MIAFLGILVLASIVGRSLKYEKAKRLMEIRERDDTRNIQVLKIKSLVHGKLIVSPRVMTWVAYFQCCLAVRVHKDLSHSWVLWLSITSGTGQRRIF